MKSTYGKHSKSVIRILEEAIQFLRLAPATLFLCYYIGSLPFILGLLYFWADMSRSAYAMKHLAVASLGLALLFVWMKFWHAIFGMQIRTKLFDTPQASWSLSRLFALAASQTLIHSTGLFILPLAAFVMLPFGWAYAFYQNVSVQVENESCGVRVACRKSWQQAKQWSLQNHMLMTVLSLFGLVILINSAVAILILPYVLKKFLGIETVFTFSGFHAVNTTFLASALGISYLCLDPLIKTVYALRCFYGEALTSGADLKAELKSFRSLGKILAAALILISCIAPNTANGSDKIERSSAEIATISSEELDRTINEVLERREFAWRLPREKQQAEDAQQTGAFASVIRWIVEKTKKVFETIKNWIQKFIEWLNKLWPSSGRADSDREYDWRQSVRLFLVLLFIGLAVFLGYQIVKKLRNRQSSAVEIESEAILPIPDLADEEIKADELPVNRWLELAKELMAKGDLRLAMRAIYLATLAYLAERELITVEIYKSNREYEKELYRRAHAKNDLLGAFSKNVMIFDRIWYGMHNVTLSDVDNYLIDQERIMALAG